MNGWILGYLIAVLVVVVLVAVLLLMIVGARRTAEKAETILARLNQARDGTASLWELGTTASTAERIAVAAQTARRLLTPGTST